MIRLYMDWISQPSRAVKAVFDIINVPYELKALKVQFDEHKTPAYIAINPMQQVPAIQDGDFTMAESHAIMKYVIRSRNIQTSLYPYSDVKTSARIDQYLDYHHTNTRRCLHLYHYVLISPIKGESVIPEVLEKERQDVAKVFNHFEQNLLKNSQYLCGDCLTLADISAGSEMIQLDMIKYNFAQYPQVHAWLKRVLKNPQVNAAHNVAFKIIKKQNPGSDFLNLL